MTGQSVRHAFLAVERRTTAIALGGACSMLVAASMLGLYQILARFVLQQPAEWSEVLIRFTLICLSEHVRKTSRMRASVIFMLEITTSSISCCVQTLPRSPFPPNTRNP